MTPAEVRAIREALGLTRREMVKLLNITESALYKWEAGTRPVSGPGAELLRRIWEERREKKQQRAAAPPICDQCNVKMYRFEGEEHGKRVSGWSCDLCGWSFDDAAE